MIAVFCKSEEDLKLFNPRPKKNFKRIRSINDIDGVNFTGVMLIDNFTGREFEIIKAYGHLKKIQPELFTD